MLGHPSRQLRVSDLMSSSHPLPPLGAERTMSAIRNPAASTLKRLAAASNPLIVLRRGLCLAPLFSHRLQTGAAEVLWRHHHSELAFSIEQEVERFRVVRDLGRVTHIDD